MRLLERLRLSRDGEERGLSPVDWFTFGGVSYPLYGNSAMPFTLSQSGEKVIKPDAGMVGMAEGAYKVSASIASLVFVRQFAFSTVEFKWQNLTSRELYGDQRLALLENPWPGGTTQNLLAKMSVDADVSGNSYWIVSDGQLRRLRPDRVDIVLEEGPHGTLQKVGYTFRPDGPNTDRVFTFLPDEVVHYMPLQDPVNPWRGMSWMTPVIRELMVDQAATVHQQRFFENGAALNIAVSLDPSVSPEQAEKFIELFRANHEGSDKAFRTAFLGGGANLTVVGTDLAQLDLRNVQGGLETRMAAAAGVPVSIAGFREGNQGSALNASTYGHARRRFADLTIWPLWQEVCGSFSSVMSPPAGSRLWVDPRHNPFLREDAKDVAEIVRTQMASVRQGIDAGFAPDAAVDAVLNDDLSQLKGKHTGLTSVQLVPPGVNDQSNSIAVPVRAVPALLSAGWTQAAQKADHDHRD